jgi:exosortase A-associated hydrolase 1
MNPTELPAILECGGQRLLAIIHPAARPSSTGVVIVVGGPQYRVGSHRQFVSTARTLARAGYPVLRFDYRGMGDSDGDARAFDSVADDIRTAVDHLVATQRVSEVVLFGLCDAASASLMFCPTDPRVRGLILLNPWVRTTDGEARSFRHYYIERLLSRSFWRKAILGQWRAVDSARALLKTLASSRSKGRPDGDGAAPFIVRMYEGLAAFKGEALVLLSSGDLTAREFVDWCARNQAWKQAMARDNIVLSKLDDADHTLSSRPDLDAANQLFVDWLHTRWPH